MIVDVAGGVVVGKERELPSERERKSWGETKNFHSSGEAEYTRSECGSGMSGWTRSFGCFVVVSSSIKKKGEEVKSSRRERYGGATNNNNLDTQQGEMKKNTRAEHRRRRRGESSLNMHKVESFFASSHQQQRAWCWIQVLPFHPSSYASLCLCSGGKMLNFIAASPSFSRVCKI